MRDEAMTAGEMGADYVMFGEPRGEGPAMPLELLLERVGWWAEIFETPCVAYAETVEAAGGLARAGADFVALGGAVWEADFAGRAVREAHALVSQARRGDAMTRLPLAASFGLLFAATALAPDARRERRPAARQCLRRRNAGPAADSLAAAGRRQAA